MAGGGVGSSRRRRKAKTKAAASNSESTNLKGLSCNICGRTFCSSQAVGEHQKIHKLRPAKDKAEVSDDVPYPDKAMEKIPEEISNNADDIPSHEEENSGDRKQELGKDLLINKYCRSCCQPGDHWTFQCPNQDKAKQKLPTKVSDVAANLVPKVSDDIPYSGQGTIAGGGVQSSCPNKLIPKPSCFSETKSRLAKDKLNLIPEVLESNDVVTYPGSRIPQPKGPVTFSQLIEIEDALEKENSYNWQLLTKKEDTCFMCGLKMGKDCIHFDEDGVFQVPDCAFCGSIGDHWSHHCPNYSNETYWAAYRESGKIPWGLYKKTETKT